MPPHTPQPVSRPQQVGGPGRSARGRLVPCWVARSAVSTPVHVLVVMSALLATLLLPAAASSAQARRSPTEPKQAVATGSGGAVASVDPDATRIGVDVLRRGGNAVDAAVATAAALGVTEPYSAGIGGGGYLLYLDPRTHTVHTLDGRERAPAAMTARSFLDPGTGRPMPFDQAVNSGLSVGVPGTVATWQEALHRWGGSTLSQALGPAANLAQAGFVVDPTFREQTAQNAARFADIAPTAALFLPGGKPPPVGSRLRNPDLARTYRELAAHGAHWFYHGPLSGEIARTAQHPPRTAGATRTFTPGLLTAADIADYQVQVREPTRVEHAGTTVYGMAPSSSGGSTVAEALNILAARHVERLDTVDAAHAYLEASRLAFADRNRWVADPSTTRVPLDGLLSRSFAAERACLIDPAHAAPGPVAPGDPRHPARTPTQGCGTTPPPPPTVVEPHEGRSTTHLVTADRWGGVVSYTLTIEQTGGSAITVPHRGFLLNNELTDFDLAPPPASAGPALPDPNLPGPGKRPRSSMSPTIVLRDGQPLLALGSPGGATIITTVLQILTERLDRAMSLPDAIAAPRLSQRNTQVTETEPAVPPALRAALTARGQVIQDSDEIGAATGVEFLPDGRVQAVAEPSRRGGGSAAVVQPG